MTNEGNPKDESPGERMEMRDPLLERFHWIAVVAIVVGGAAACIWVTRPGSPGAASLPLPPALVPDEPRALPDFSLVDQTGRTVTLDNLKGQVWVADFFFTHCPAQCPRMMERMGRLQHVLPDDAPVKLVSITVDPERDSPDVLAEYAKRFGAEDDRWLFLTGDKQAIIQLAREGFLLPAGDDPNDHSLRLTLVDAEGRIRGWFDSQDDDSLAALQRQLKQIARGG